MPGQSLCRGGACGRTAATVPRVLASARSAPSRPATKPLSQARCSSLNGAASGIRTCISRGLRQPLPGERAQRFGRVPLARIPERSRPPSCGARGRRRAVARAPAATRRAARRASLRAPARAARRSRRRDRRGSPRPRLPRPRGSWRRAGRCRRCSAARRSADSR